MPRFLVLDDSAIARNVARRLAKQHGIEVIEASSCDQAFALLDALDEAPDAALLDLELPDGLGVRVANAIKARWHRCPIVFISATEDEQLLSLARDIAPVFDKTRLAEAILAVRQAP